MALTSVELTPHIGSEIKADLDTLLSGAVSGEVRDLLVQRGVIVFRDLEMSDDQQRAFTRTLGDLRLGTVKKEGEEGLMKVTFDEKENPEYAKFFFGSLLWHMDGTYEEVPPLATLFTPFKLSREGGDTMFANTYAAYEDLPDAEKVQLAQLRVVHTMQAALFPAKRNCSPEEFAVWASYPERSHPLVWHHRSGRKSLVLSTSGAYVEGMHPAESHNLLQRLMAHATQEKYTYRHKWQLGDLVIWDNTGSMHRVMAFDKASGREFHRCTLNGEEPISSPRRRPALQAG